MSNTFFKTYSNKSPFSAFRMKIKYLVFRWKMLWMCITCGWLSLISMSSSRGKNFFTKSLGALETSTTLQAKYLACFSSLFEKNSARNTLAYEPWKRNKTWFFYASFSMTYLRPIFLIVCNLLRLVSLLRTVVREVPWPFCVAPELIRIFSLFYTGILGGFHIFFYLAKIKWSAFMTDIFLTISLWFMKNLFYKFCDYSTKFFSLLI